MAAEAAVQKAEEVEARSRSGVRGAGGGCGSRVLAYNSDDDEEESEQLAPLRRRRWWRRRRPDADDETQTPR